MLQVDQSSVGGTQQGAPHILLVWGHGKNLGHVARLGAIAKVLRDLGCRLSWAVPALHVALVEKAAALPNETVSDFAEVGTTGATSPPRSFADVLRSFGFSDATTLQRLTSHWLQLFAVSNVDGVVLDYAPEAQVAAMIARIPAAQVTNGFDSPPPTCPPFEIGVRGPMIERQNRESVARIDDAISRVADQLGGQINASLSTVLAYPAKWFDCAPEADPYGPREGAYVGPLGQPVDTLEVDWPTKALAIKRVFVYLRDDEQVRVVLDILAALNVAVICTWPAAPSDMLGSTGLQTIVNQPVNLPKVLQTCDAVINYGSSTLVSQCLLAGKPQIMLPTDVEKWLVSSRVAATGASMIVRWPTKSEDLRSAISTTLGSAKLRANGFRTSRGIDVDLKALAVDFVECVRHY